MFKLITFQFNTKINNLKGKTLDISPDWSFIKLMATYFLHLGSYSKSKSNSFDQSGPTRIKRHFSNLIDYLSSQSLYGVLKNLTQIYNVNAEEHNVNKNVSHNEQIPKEIMQQFYF
jgi:hypothetical protein